jgi:hypothetical protein
MLIPDEASGSFRQTILFIDCRCELCIVSVLKLDIRGWVSIVFRDRIKLILTC